MVLKNGKDANVALNALTLSDVDILMKMVRDNDIEEVELESKGLKVRVTGRSRRDEQLMASHAYNLAVSPAAMAHSPHPQALSMGVPPAAMRDGVAEPEGEPKTHYVEIISPMVGTFYRAPSPDMQAYVEVGDRITEDTVMCIVEAMKLMNEIKAEVSGIVSEILVENGQPVEFGQVLFRIEPAE